MNYNNFYINQKRSLRRTLSRFRLGGQQIAQHPWHVIIMIGIVILIFIAWQSQKNIISAEYFPATIYKILEVIIQALLMILCIVSEIAYIKVVGELTARETEACVAVAFKLTETADNHPILISQKTGKQKGMKILEFYSDISMKEWKDKMDSIADMLNVHFVKPHIEYGGKQNNNGRIIRLYTLKGRTPQERGFLYDDEL